MRSELEIGNDPAGIRYCVLLDDCTRHWRTDDAFTCWKIIGLNRRFRLHPNGAQVEIVRGLPLRKALLGVANRRRRHERRSHLQVQVRVGDACLEWLPIASRWDREFESVFLQRGVSASQGGSSAIARMNSRSVSSAACRAGTPPTRRPSSAISASARLGESRATSPEILFEFKIRKIAVPVALA
jgi:hypothetical protein